MYIDILKNVVKKKKYLFEEVKQGHFSQVCYQETRNQENGTYDAHYTNRLRLAYYLLLEHQDCEMIVKKLFEEELKDRQNNSFQGIGTCLEILTFLLMKFNHGQYDELFEQAKQANFDCYCGYDQYKSLPSDYKQYHLDDCIDICVDIQYMNEARELLELWKQDIHDWDKVAYEKLIYYNRYTKQEIFNEEPLKKLLELAINETNHKQTHFTLKKDSQNHIILAWTHLINYYIHLKMYEQAYQNFYTMIHQIDLTPIQHIRLFDTILEDCLDLIVHYEEKRIELWNWIKPILQQKDKHMYGNLYQKSIIAAKVINDDYVNVLNNRYEVWKKDMQI